MLIPIKAIHCNGNLRHTVASREEDEALQASLAALGQLQPILVRPVEEDDPVKVDAGYVLIAGYRRLMAMRAIGADEIEAHVRPSGEQIATAMQAAENMVRIGMDPVDQWNAVRTLMETGYDAATAGQMLGLSETGTRRLQKLSGIAPKLLEALRGHPLPPARTLGTLASAPHEMQLKAFERHLGDWDQPILRWTTIAAECVVKRIPRSRAIFDIESAQVLFEEDLFAEPGSDAQFTTADVAGFMAAQDAALQERVHASPEPGLVVEYNRQNGLPRIPKGFVLAAIYGAAADKLLSKKGKRKRLHAITPAIETARPGEVMSIIIEPAPVASKPAAGAQTDSEADEAEAANESTDANTVIAEPEPGSGPAITKQGQKLLAVARTEALRAALTAPGVTAREMLALMVLACCAPNGLDRGSGRYDDLAAALLSPAGELLPIAEDDVVHIAGEALRRTLFVRSAEDMKSPYLLGSGDAAEWIGATLNAGALMPRLDTEAFLSTVGTRTLREIAVNHGLADGTKAALIARLIGHAPNINPIPFGAPAPRTRPWTMAEAEQDG